MPSELYEHLQDGLLELERAIARSAKFGEIDLPVVPSMEMRGTLIDVGGNPVEVDFSLVVRAILFPTADSEIHTADGDWTADGGVMVPKTGMIVEFGGHRYKVLSVGRCPSRSSYMIHFGDPESGR